MALDDQIQRALTEAPPPPSDLTQEISDVAAAKTGRAVVDTTTPKQSMLAAETARAVAKEQTAKQTQKGGLAAGEIAQKRATIQEIGELETARLSGERQRGLTALTSDELRQSRAINTKANDRKKQLDAYYGIEQNQLLDKYNQDLATIGEKQANIQLVQYAFMRRLANEQITDQIIARGTEQRLEHELKNQEAIEDIINGANTTIAWIQAGASRDILRQELDLYEFMAPLETEQLIALAEVEHDAAMKKQIVLGATETTKSVVGYGINQGWFDTNPPQGVGVQTQPSRDVSGRI